MFVKDARNVVTLVDESTAATLFMICRRFKIGRLDGFTSTRIEEKEKRDNHNPKMQESADYGLTTV